MSRMYFLAASLRLVPFLAMSGGAVAAASECRPDCPTPSLQDAFDSSAAVFRGNIISIQHVPHQPFGLYYVVTITVDAVWKGTAGSTAQVMTTSDVDGCGFVDGWRFLVFARLELGELWAAGCNRTHVTDSNDPDVTALGPPLRTPVVAPSWGMVKALYR